MQESTCTTEMMPKYNYALYHVKPKSKLYNFIWCSAQIFTEMMALFWTRRYTLLHNIQWSLAFPNLKFRLSGHDSI